MLMTIPVIDVFAGPGGLNEGFSALGGGSVFRTVASIEKDPVACQTLTLRAAVRRARLLDGVIPDAYHNFTRTKQTSLSSLEVEDSLRVHLKDARSEVHECELGAETHVRSHGIIERALEAAMPNSPWVLIGGPPCQAYSLAGRSRRRHDPSFATDEKHTLYREYLRIIDEHLPDVFVMENVKGLLSSRHEGGRVFDAICADLDRAGIRHDRDEEGYEVRSFIVDGVWGELESRNFVIRSEDFGVPQARHRVILLGVRRKGAATGPFSPLQERPRLDLRHAIDDLPEIRSEVSPIRQDSWPAWLALRDMALSEAGRGPSETGRLTVDRLGASHFDNEIYEREVHPALRDWIRQDLLQEHGVVQHESRRHMAGDLLRYAYLARLAEDGETRRVNELPPKLAPNHQNGRRADAPFADRFRVQRWNGPSSTVTSHIAKDGHYYIHPDPTQMRSLSVREAARLQTFPDNYFFMGHKTQQYQQVGNAVPPLLATQLAGTVATLLGVPAD